MPVFAHLLIASAYIILSAVVGIATIEFANASVTLAAIVATVLSFTGAQLHMLMAQSARHRESEHKLLTIRDDMRKVTQKADVLDARITSLDDKMDQEIEERRDTLVGELRELEVLIAQLGKNIDKKFKSAEVSAAVPNLPTANLSGDTALASVQEALNENRVDLHLQPIVSLPQRRVCFYEGFTRLRDQHDRLIMPKDFLSAAREAGLLGVIDNMLLFRCVQIVRRLNERDRRVGVFCNVAMSSLEDEQFFPQFLDFMRDHQDLSGSLIFEIGKASFDKRTAVGARHMGRLADLGFRFSIDKAETLEVDLAELQGEGVRFMKVEGDKLVSQLVSGGSRPISSITKEVAPEDVSAVFSRYGVDLIAEKIEDEKTVVEVLDFNLAYGQGHVFGAPRPIKGTLLKETTPPSEFVQRAQRAFG